MFKCVGFKKQFCIKDGWQNRESFKAFFWKVIRFEYLDSKQHAYSKRPLSNAEMPSISTSISSKCLKCFTYFFAVSKEN